jgi:lysophospholipase L1-like esterase
VTQTGRSQCDYLMNRLLTNFFFVLVFFSAHADAEEAQTIEAVSAAETAQYAHSLGTVTNGRVTKGAGTAEGEVLRQWPGTYFETAFAGSEVAFVVGRGDVSLRIRVDDAAPLPLVRPAPGLYRVAGLTDGEHRLRVDVASESQAGPTAFGGFRGGDNTVALPMQGRALQMEFIGDSGTVGYGNMSTSRECTDDEVWATTDTSQGIAALTAAAFDADYQVNAISGRGIVRNYDGSAGDTLVQAYPYVLFDKAEIYQDADWQPEVVAIELGTNDFSTPLHAEEKWASRDELQADFTATYIRFVQMLRERYPRATFVLWASDLNDGEIAAQVRKVAQALKALGDDRVSFMLVTGLAMDACHWHPSLSDDAAIAARLAGHIREQLGASDRMQSE